MNTSMIPVGGKAERHQYAAKYAVEFFERKRIPSYALWAISLKDPVSGRYPKIPTAYGRTDTLEQAHLSLTAWCEANGLTLADIRPDMIPWRLVKDLLSGKNGAEFMARQVKRREAPNQVLNIPQPTTDLVVIEDGRVWTDSLVIAEKFSKRHKNVLQAIDNLPPDEFTRLNFQPAVFIDKNGDERRMVKMTWKGFSMLAMGFTGAKAYQWKQNFLDAFEDMGEYIDRLKQAFRDPPRAGILETKRAAHHPMMDALIEVRADDGKDTEAKHFTCENRLCNWVVTGKFAAIDESALSNADLDLLRLVRERNAAFLMSGLPYDARKARLATYAAKVRARPALRLAA